jgi:hypothetical protein
MTNIEKWFLSMRNIWISKNPDKISEILSPINLRYYESPFALPLTSVNEVVQEWQIIKQQEIISIDINILNQTDDSGTAMWSFKQVGSPESRGCYYLEVDSQGLCVLFRQWWNSQ